MTYQPTPRIEIYPARLQHNAAAVKALCSAQNARLACVVKCMAGNTDALYALKAGGADMLADSRLSNLRAIAASGVNLPTLLLRGSMAAEAAEVVRYATCSLQSSAPAIRLLSDAARLAGVTHQVILMVDLGDLREGVWPERLVDEIQLAAQCPNIEIIGLGSNLACYGGVIPSAENMRQLVHLRDACRAATGLPLEVLSGGNSANLPLLASGKMPAEINLFRVGESVVIGRNALDRTPWPGTRQDTFRIVATVIEVERKPSIPIGVRGQDAFGGETEFVDRGVRKRALCNIGRQDIVVDAVNPQDPGIIVLGGSSDHLVLDVEEASWDVQFGDEIAFYPMYGALLAAMTSPYMHKVVLNDSA